jgi:hypothetical protein
MDKLSLLLGVAILLTVGVGRTEAQVSETWTGHSDGNDGDAEYAARCGYECSESYSLVIRCDKNLGTAELTINADSPYAPGARVRVVFVVDNARFNLEGITDEGGLFGPVPTISLSMTSALMEALSAGQQFEVFFEPGNPVFEGHLDGSRDAILVDKI